MDNIRKKYLVWEWRTIIVLSIGYALFYFVTVHHQLLEFTQTHVH